MPRISHFLRGFLNINWNPLNQFLRDQLEILEVVNIPLILTDFRIIEIPISEHNNMRGLESFEVAFVLVGLDAAIFETL